MQNVPQADLDSVRRWHFAIGGIETRQDSFSLGQAIELRRLRSFPTHEQLALSLSSLPVAGMVAQYGEDYLSHELVIDAEYIDDTRRIFPTAEIILAGLRVRTAAEIISPALCDHSWATLGEMTGNQCKAYHFERGLSLQASTGRIMVVQPDIDWVMQHVANMLKLTENDQFATAIEAICSYMHAVNDRMKVAQLWAGIESIFGRQFGEVGFRISVLTALLLEARGPACRNLSRELKSLYNTRSKALHGGKVDAEKLQAHVEQVRKLLAQLLRKVIELGHVPTDDDFEDLLFVNKN